MGFGGFGQIPWSRIKEYANEAGLEEDNRETFYTVIETMDAVWLEDQSVEMRKKRQEAEEEAKKRTK